MATNYEKYASTPEKVADLLHAFDCVRRDHPAVESYMSYAKQKKRDAEVHDFKELKLEWLQEESE